jgi:adenosine/AMP kinase
MLLSQKNLNIAKTNVELATLVITTFLEQAENQSDLNQVAFNSIIKKTLETACFTECFEKLLVRSGFQLNIIENVLSPNSVESIFEIYSVDANGTGVLIDYTDEVLVNSIMGIALPKSRLMGQLINQAYDFDQDDKYTS